MTAQTPIAIVGVAALFAGSKTTDGFWRDIVAGTDLMSEVPPSHWSTEDYYDPTPGVPDRTYADRGSFLDEVDFAPMDFGIPPNILPATDTSQLLALIVAKRLIEDSHGAFERVSRERTGVVLGASTTELCLHMAGRLQMPVWKRAMVESGLEEEQVRAISERVEGMYVPWNENTFPGLLGNVVAGRIANRFDLGGTNCCVDAACASSLAAVEVAVNELSVGRADLMISGGVDVLNDILMYVCFSQTGALSRTGDCRPFASNADGTMLAEGLGLFALKRLDDAERDGDLIHAVIRGIGASSDGRAKSIYAPRQEGQAAALRRAYEAAGYDPATVELLEAHGTATAAGDAAETAALREVFGPTSRHRGCALGSVKSQIGHAKAAAGAAGLFKAVMALQHRVLPPTIKIDEPNPRLQLDDSPFYLNTEARPWIRGADHPRRAGVSAFGFGGTNFHVTLEEYVGRGRRAGRRRTLPSELVLLSASSSDALFRAAAAMADEVRDADGVLQYVARQSQERFDHRAAMRLAVVANDERDLAAKLDDVARTGGATSSPDVHLGTDSPGEVALLFGGRGAESVGMGRDVALSFDLACDLWDLAASIELDPRWRLPDLVFPPPAFTDAERSRQAKALRAPEAAIPAAAATSLSILRLLGALGLDARRTAGAEGGELASLVAAGVAAEDDALRLARKRGELAAEEFAKFVESAPEGLRMVLEANASFTHRIESLYASGARIFVDVGPSDQMTRRVAELLGDRPHHRVTVDGRPNGIDGLWNALGQLSALGVPLQLAALWREYEEVSDPRAADAPAFSVKLSGSNYGKPLAGPRRRAAPPLTPAPPSGADEGTADAITETRRWLETYREEQRERVARYREDQQTLAQAHASLLRSMVFTGPNAAPVVTGERTFTLDPGRDEWLLDHRPTFTRPALPMMCVVDELARAAREATGEAFVTELRGVEVRRWIIIDGATRFTTRAEPVPQSPGWVHVVLMREGEEIAQGHVHCAGAPATPPAPRPLDARLEPIALPYVDGTLFHGPAFQKVVRIESANGVARGVLDADPGAVGVGLLNPAVLDAAIHLIPYERLHDWAATLPTDHLAYPVRVDQLAVFGTTPTAGQLDVSVRFLGTDASNLPTFDIEFVHGGDVWATMRLVEALFPKGRLGSGDPAARRAFLRDRQYVPGLGLSVTDGGTTRLEIPVVRKNDWFEGTVAAVYDASGDLRELARQVAIKDHFGRRFEVHPSRVTVDGDRVRVPGQAEAMVARVTMDGPMTFVVRG